MALAELSNLELTTHAHITKQSLAHLNLAEKDVLVLKSIFNSSSNFFPNIEFKEQCSPKQCDLILINGSGEGAIAKWKALKARFPNLKTMLLADTSKEQDFLQQQLKTEVDAVVLSRPLQARNVKQAIEYLTGKGDMGMNSVNSVDTKKLNDTEPPLFKKNTNSALRILVVDDSAPARQYINVKIDQLMDEKAEVEFAESGEKALEISKNKQFDLVFLDVEMPGINGFEVCKQLRAKSDKLRIVMLTGKKLSQDYVTGREAGCNHYLTKPPQDSDVRTILTLSTLKKKTAL